MALKLALKNNLVKLLDADGNFKAYSKTKPEKVLINNRQQMFSYTDNEIAVNIPAALKKPLVQIFW
jgi:hypothetical protein